MSEEKKDEGAEEAPQAVPLEDLQRRAGLAVNESLKHLGKVLNDANVGLNPPMVQAMAMLAVICSKAIGVDLARYQAAVAEFYEKLDPRDFLQVDEAPEIIH